MIGRLSLRKVRKAREAHLIKKAKTLHLFGKKGFCVKRHHILMSESFEGGFRCDVNLNNYLLSSFDCTFSLNKCLVFEISRGTELIKKRKKSRPCNKPVSRQNKFTSAPFSALIACADEAAVTDQWITVII